MRKPRQLRARLPPDLLARASRLALPELVSSGTIRGITDRVVNHVYSTTGQFGMVAYAELVVHDPARHPREFVLARYPERSSGVCVAQATVCVHPIGCRDIHAAIDPGTGDWTPVEPGTAVISCYGPKGADAVPHELTWTQRKDAVGCVCLRLLLCGPP